jgi:hypothetical protein
MSGKADGLVESVDGKRSSGYTPLGRHVVQHVKNSFRFSTNSTSQLRYFEKDFEFQPE